MSDNPRPFSRETDAAIRLYLQHWIFKFEAGFLLHPLISTSQSPEFKVLDVGCGTGLWLVDLAQSFPNAQLDGFDLSTAHFPTGSELPKNVNLWQQDALEPVPDKLVGLYDIVHISGVHIFVEDKDLARMAANFSALLKPGGWLQWSELDVPGMRVASFCPTQEWPAFAQLRQYLMEYFRHSSSATSALENIPSILQTVGLESYVSKRWEVSQVMSKPWTNMQLIAQRDYTESVFVPVMLKRGAPEAEINGLRKIGRDVEIEVAESGLRISIDLFYAVARRPVQ